MSAERGTRALCVLAVDRVGRRAARALAGAGRQGAREGCRGAGSGCAVQLLPRPMIALAARSGWIGPSLSRRARAAYLPARRPARGCPRGQRPTSAPPIDIDRSPPRRLPPSPAPRPAAKPRHAAIGQAQRTSSSAHLLRRRGTCGRGGARALHRECGGHQAVRGRAGPARDCRNRHRKLCLVRKAARPRSPAAPDRRAGRGHGCGRATAACAAR
jgi:hypothetical protein